MISVAVVGCRTSGNLGAIARVMANFGLEKLFIINPECEVITDESKARAMRAFSILQKAAMAKDLSDIGADYLIATSAKLGTGNNLRRVYLTPEQLSKNIDNKLHYCIVLGREDKGLFNDEIKNCNLLVHIPTSKSYKAMNISHSLAIILYELFRQKEEIKQVANRRERRAVLLRLEAASGNVDNFENFREVFENLMNRAFIRKKEARALAGLFKKIKN